MPDPTAMAPVPPPTPDAYRKERELADAAEREEQQITFRDALKADRRLIRWGIGFSGTIIMEGYGMAMIPALFPLDQFEERFGDETIMGGSDGLRTLSTRWRILLPFGAQVGAIAGLFIGSWASRKFGYRTTTLAMLCFTIAFTFISFFAPGVKTLFLGYTLQGIPWGAYQVTALSYSSEVASVQLRPMMTTWINLCWVLGQLIAAGVLKGCQTLNGAKAYQIPIAVNWIASALLLAVLFFAPESPFYYLKAGKVIEATGCIRRLVVKGDEQAVQRKLALMQQTLDQETAAAAFEHHSTEGQGWLRRQVNIDIFKGTDRRRTMIATVTWVIQSTCGSSLISWAPVFLQQAGLDLGTALSLNLAIAGFGAVGTILSWWLMRYMGRRQIYIWGLLLLASLLSLCGGLAFLPSKVATGWAAGAIIIVFTFVYDLSIGPICYAIVSEVSSVTLRSSTTAVARAAYLVTGLGLHCLTPAMLNEHKWNLGAKSALVFAVLCIGGLVYTWFCLPELDKLSARQIDILFRNKIKTREFNVARASQLDGKGDAASGVLTQA